MSQPTFPQLNISLETVLGNLCLNDPRNPDAMLDEDPEFNRPPSYDNYDCYCDSCHRGQTLMANEILRLIGHPEAVPYV